MKENTLGSLTVLSEARWREGGDGGASNLGNGSTEATKRWSGPRDNQGRDCGGLMITSIGLQIILINCILSVATAALLILQGAASH